MKRYAVWLLMGSMAVIGGCMPSSKTDIHVDTPKNDEVRIFTDKAEPPVVQEINSDTKVVNVEIPTAGKGATDPTENKTGVVAVKKEY